MGCSRYYKNILKCTLSNYFEAMVMNKKYSGLFSLRILDHKMYHGSPLYCYIKFNIFSLCSRFLRFNNLNNLNALYTAWVRVRVMCRVMFIPI